MKKLLIIFLLTPAILLAQKQTSALVNGGVDERIELLSIVFRLAENPEYCGADFKSYVEDINKHFSAYKNHPVIQLAKQLRKEQGVSYDAVMRMAVHLTPPPQLSPSVKFTNDVPENRWGKKQALKFVELLQQFYVDANCKSFFEKHKELYEASGQRLSELISNVDIEWYKQFFGQQPKGRFIVIAGLGTGTSNYGANVLHKNGEEDIYAILGTWNIDSTNTPIYPPKRYLSTLVHEFNHSFANQLIDKHWSKLATSASNIYPKVEETLRNQAYGNAKIMMYEALVRSSELKYGVDHGGDSLHILVAAKREELKGFLQMPQLVEKLKEYDKNRTYYPTLDSYMPQIASFYQAMAANIDSIMVELSDKIPQVKSVEPFANEATNVDLQTSEIKIIFDKPMFGRGHSFSNGGNGGKLDFKVIGYTDNNTAITLQVNKLEPNTTYELIMHPQGFLSKDMYQLPTSYTVTFTTAAE